MFSRYYKPSPCQKCQNPCVTARIKDDTLSAAVAASIQSLTGRPEEEHGLLPTDGHPQMYSADSSPCLQKAFILGPKLRRFNRYREALPYARAASDLNSQLGDTAKEKDKKVKAECLNRLPVAADALCDELGLPRGTIKDEDLRDEDSGFRAVMYRDESTGKLILVARDTQPKSLVDWQTNTRNGEGRDTAQYWAMRTLAGRLTDAGVDYDIAGYSKGGGLAQEAALVNPKAQAYLFNSAGLHENSLARTGNTDFASLESRSHAFSAESDFLTFMNETTDPEQQIENARFLRRELEGENRWGVDPMKIEYHNPEHLGEQNEQKKAKARYMLSQAANPIPFPLRLGPTYDKGEQRDINKNREFSEDLERYFDELDRMILKLEEDHEAGRPLNSFPPVRAVEKEVVPNSMSRTGKWLGAKNPGPNIGKLAQHEMKRVLGPIEKQLNDDREKLKRFIRDCT
ncbi:MAG: hypothetical protein VBE63_21445 [Lamprobacter sp.]|uniref:hypothetical protein n=1 Tax=Lamprobacter sp. TaxID=3100796 RepID=UPI002B25EEB5|nr:hypothetical protein [Lamprobacter sp.]MEA3642486.1 hypothetical protein [Lamprobacter sp.]